jgi:alanine dehydrogenase
VKGVMTLFLTNDEVAKVLTMEDAVASMEIAFRDLARGETVNRPRSHSYAHLKEDTFYRFMSMDGIVPRLGVAAIRLTSDITYEPEIGGMRRLVKIPALPGKKFLGLVLLFSIQNGELLAIMHDSHLQRMRVGATSALAAKCLAREEGRRVGLFGTGGQAGPQLEALCLVRKIESVNVFSPNRDHRASFARTWSEKLGIDIHPVGEPREAVRGYRGSGDELVGPGLLRELARARAACQFPSSRRARPQDLRAGIGHRDPGAGAIELLYDRETEPPTIPQDETLHRRIRA